MPVPQRVNFLVEQASCLFLRMVQDVSQTKDFGNKQSFCQISHSKTVLFGSDFPDC
ncbi:MULTISPECIES: hypothetical protein [unclassified Microcoleus]|uniref:hypothetical protein n=1 Tax=unclassified Microcoleus TaxID=2642155 RepID=UPI002FD74901